MKHDLVTSLQNWICYFISTVCPWNCCITSSHSFTSNQDIGSEVIKVARKILAQPALAEHAGDEVGPGFNAQSDDELNEYIRSKADTAYHPCGTCKMGVDDMSDVDQNLKVKGIENLRVIDASIIPEIPSANLNAPTLMIAEKASDLILN